MYLTPEKRYPYWAEPPRIGYFRRLPLPPPPMYCVTPSIMLIHVFPEKTNLDIGKAEKNYTLVTVR